VLVSSALDEGEKREEKEMNRKESEERGEKREARAERRERSARIRSAVVPQPPSSLARGPFVWSQTERGESREERREKRGERRERGVRIMSKAVPQPVLSLARGLFVWLRREHAALAMQPCPVAARYVVLQAAAAPVIQISGVIKRVSVLVLSRESRCY
jgi:hypothetical protein